MFHQLKMSGQDMMWLNEEVENWTRRIQRTIDFPHMVLGRLSLMTLEEEEEDVY